MSLFKVGYSLLTENSVDKLLFLLDKPIAKLLNREVTLYHGTCYDIKDNKLTPMGINVGATKYSNPRWSTFFWYNKEQSIKWALCWSVGRKKTNYRSLYRGQNDTILLYDKSNPTMGKDELINKIVSECMYAYVYTVKVPASKVEIGSCATIEEYTISEPVKIHKREKIKVTRKLLEDHFTFVTEDEYNKVIEEIFSNMGEYERVRNPILNMILNDQRDLYRREVRLEIKAGKIKEGDDITYLKKQINNAIKNNEYNLGK